MWGKLSYFEIVLISRNLEWYLSQQKPDYSFAEILRRCLHFIDKQKIYQPHTKQFATSEAKNLTNKNVPALWNIPPFSISIWVVENKNATQEKR